MTFRARPEDRCSALGGGYEGRLTADGNSITGTWTQGAPAPLNLARATPATAWAIPEPPPPPTPMAADANLVFEVATIKPANPEVHGQSLLVAPNDVHNHQLDIERPHHFCLGYSHPPDRDGQSWLESERFDITAKPQQTGIPNVKQLRTMVQKLVAERFRLAFHPEKKELSAYMVTVGKNGPKLSKNETGGNLPGFGGRGPGAIGVRNSTMAEFASFLQARILDRPVVDQTGLSGKWDFTLEWRPDPTQAVGRNRPTASPGSRRAAGYLHGIPGADWIEARGYKDPGGSLCYRPRGKAL